MNGVHKLIILLGSFASSYVDGSEKIIYQLLQVYMLDMYFDEKP
jgi:hypothetical protein